MGFLRIQLGQFTANHHGDDIVLTHLRRRPGANVLAIADHADKVRDRFHLVELVRNIDTGDPVIAQIRNDRQQRGGFTFGQ
ncbi:hypothetical protein D3C76_1594520 [compost metagenome]